MTKKEAVTKAPTAENFAPCSAWEDRFFRRNWKNLTVEVGFENET